MTLPRRDRFVFLHKMAVSGSVGGALEAIMHGMRRATAPESPAAGRLPFLEGMRGLLALYVVFSHLCSMADPSSLAGRASTAPNWLRSAMAPFGFGHLAVAGFIVLSGFCLEISLFGSGDGRLGNARRFFVRRARRILPPYYAALALSILVCFLVTERLPGMPFEMYLPVTTENVLAHVFLVHNFSVDWMYKLNGVLWSIAIEAQLYLVFPLLVLLIGRFGRVATALASTGLACVVLATVDQANKLYPWYLPLFAAGMVAAHFAYRPSLRRGVRPGLAWLAVFAGVGATIWACDAGASLPVRDAPFGIAIAALSYALTVGQSSPVARGLSWGPVVGLGTFSYSLYLMHHPIQQVLYYFRPAFVQGEAATLGYLLAVLPVIVFGTWLFHLAFERPFLVRRVRTVDPADRFIPVTLPLRTAVPAVGVADDFPPASEERARPPREPLPNSLPIAGELA